MGSGTVFDLTHDVFIKAYESAATFHEGASAILPWLLVIARNTVKDDARRNARLQVEDPAVVECRCENEADPSLERSVPRALDAPLSRDQRRVVFLRYQAGLDASAVAEMIGKSPDAVRHLEHRALVAMRRRLPIL